MSRRRMARIAMFAFVAYLSYGLFSPLWRGQSPLNFGLDLAGGVIVEYRPDFTTRLQGYESQSARQVLEKCKETLTNRLSRKLRAVPEIFVRGDDRLVVSIPSVENYRQVLDLVGRTYQLTMRLVVKESEDPLAGNDVYRHRGIYYQLEKPKFSGDMLDEARIKVLGGNPSGADPNERSPRVEFAFRHPYDEQFQLFTRDHVGKRLAILLDDNIEWAGEIRSEIREAGVLEGSESVEEARDTAILLQSGTLPVSLQVVGLSGVGPSLGQEIKAKGVSAILLSLFLLFLLLFVVYFHRIWFLLAAAVSLLSLLFFLVALAATFHFTLDTAAIAGIILSIGMGMDAFIIIFESLEPKLKKFSPADLARWGNVIIDGFYSFRYQGIVLLHPNLMILAVVLLLLQSERLRSFAEFMCLGIAGSLMTVFVTRAVLLQTTTLALHTWPDLIRGIRACRPGIFRVRKAYLCLVGILCAGYIGICFQRPSTLGLTLGSDFLPGAQIIAETRSEADIQTALKAVHKQYPEISVRYQRMGGEQSLRRYLLTLAMPSNTSTNPAQGPAASPAAASPALPSFGDSGPVTPATQRQERPLPINTEGSGTSHSSDPTTQNVIQTLTNQHLTVLRFDSVDSKVSADRLLHSLSLLPMSCVLILVYFVVFEPAISRWLSKTHAEFQLTSIGRTLVAMGIVSAAVHDVI